MAKLSAKEIIDSLKEMTLLEIKEVVDLMKEEFGVDPSAVAVAAPSSKLNPSKCSNLSLNTSLSIDLGGTCAKNL